MPKPPPPRRTSATWRKVDGSALRGRLEEVKGLLEQAAALAGAHDRDRIAAMARLNRAEEEGGAGDHPRRRRYR